MERDSARVKRLFDPIGFCPRRIHPKLKRAFGLLDVARVGFDECSLVMGNPPISRIEDHSAAAIELGWQGKRFKTRGKRNGRWVWFDFDVLPRNANLAQPFRLVEPQDLEPIDAAAPEVRDTEQGAQKEA